MTETQMITLFHQRFDASSFTNDSLGNDEVYLYLNNAYSRFINQRFTGNNPRNIPFEGDQKRIDDLRNLLVTSSNIAIVATGTEIPNSTTYLIPSDYMFHVATYVRVTRTDITNTYKYLECKIIDNTLIRNYILTSHNRPILREPLIVFRTSTHFTIINDPDTTLGTARMTYLKKYTDISSGVDCELSEHTHPEIVEMAVNLALEDIESRRFQSNTLNLTKTE